MQQQLQQQQQTIKTINDVIALKGELWRTPLLHMREVLPDKIMSDRDLIRLSKGNCTLEHLTLMTELLYTDFKRRPIGTPAIRYFFEAVDRSNYALVDWLNAIHDFSLWLKENERETSFLKMIGFIQCCEELPEKKDADLIHSISLTSILNEMLTLYGFVG